MGKFHCIAVLLLVSVTAGLRAQEIINARLSGTVLDQAGALIPGAKVTLSNRDTGLVRQYTTSETGEYVFPLIPPGTYQLKVEKTGFNVYVQSNIVLAVGQNSTLNPSLSVGSVTEAIEVTASAPLLNTGNSDLGSEVATRQIVELPLNWRNVYGFMALDSSVNNSRHYQTVYSPGRTLSDHDIAFTNFGGGRFGTTAFLLDGAWDAAGDWTAVIYVPSVEEVQEFRIQTNTFSPQFGWSTGNAVNAVTKSGTRSFHGSAFEFLRNDKLDANNFFNNRNSLARPVFRRNQFGVTVGGPLYLPGLYRQRDKTFLFGAFESLRQSSPTTIVTTVPTGAQKNGDFSQTFNPQGSLTTIYDPFTTRLVGGAYLRDPFPGNRIAREGMDRVALNLPQYWPAPNRPGAPITGQDNYVFTAGAPVSTDQYTFRADHNISNSLRLFARWSQKKQFKTESVAFFGEDNIAGPGSRRPNDKFQGGAGLTNIFSPTLVLNVNFGLGRWVEGLDPKTFPFKSSSLGLPTVLDETYGLTGFPGIGVSGVGGLGSGFHELRPRQVGSLSADLSNIHGRHTFTMGFMSVDQLLTGSFSPAYSFSFDTSFTQGPNPLAANPNTGAGFASLLLGTGNGSIQLRASPAFSKKFLGWYFNDEWRIRRNLTVNLGLRYDLQTAPTDRFDRLCYWTQEKNPLSDKVGLNLAGALKYTGDGGPRGVYDAQHTNFAPRVSFSYNPVSKLVVRAGFGLFYPMAIESGDYQGLDMSGFSQTTPWVSSLDGVTPLNLLNNPYPQGLIMPPGRSQGGLTNVGSSVNAVERGRPTSYVEQWVAGLQYEVMSNTVVQANYVGNHGVKMTFGGFQRNQIRPELLSLGNALLEQVPNPFFGVITAGSLSLRTVSRGQLLRPFPQFTSVNAIQPPSGMSTYNGLTVSANRRFSNGLQFLVSFTASKYLANAEGQEQWTLGGAGTVRNWYDTSLEKSLMGNDIPKSLVASFIYEIPVGKGQKVAPASRLAEVAFGGWQVAGIATFKDGFPLSMTAVNNTNSLGGNQRPNLSGDPRVSDPTVDRWFNTGAFAQPPPFTWGNVPRTTPYLRSPGLNNWDATFSKSWNFAEQIRLQFRSEFFNLFNHTNLYLPNTSFGSPGFGRITTANDARSIQMALKLYW